VAKPVASSAASSHGAASDYGRLHRLYARYAPTYDRRFHRYSEGTLAHAMQAIGELPPGRVLDVACGTGLLLERLRRRWPDAPILGVDLNPEMLAVAERRLPRAVDPPHGGTDAPFTDWRIGPAEALPVEGGWADTLTCTNAFHLVQQPAAALREFHRALAPQGRLVLVDWCRDFRSMRWLLLALRHGRRQQRIAWTLHDLRGAVEEAGMAVESAQRFKIGPVWGLMSITARRRGG